MRIAFISTLKSHSHCSTTPVLGAALCRSGLSDSAAEPLVDGDQKINRAGAGIWGLGSGVRGQLALHLVEVILESRREGSLQLKWFQLVAEQRVVLEREPIGLGLEIKVERVQHG